VQPLDAGVILGRSAIGSGGGGARRKGPIDVALQIWADLHAEQRTGAKRDQLMKLYCSSETQRLTNVRAKTIQDLHVLPHAASDLVRVADQKPNPDYPKTLPRGGRGRAIVVR
jgi:hypothetical protein